MNIKYNWKNILHKAYNADESKCLIWSGPTNLQGYVSIRKDGKTVLLHRWLYEKLTGDIITKGFVIDHLCNNRGCFNFKHFKKVTHGQNLKRAFDERLANSTTFNCGHLRTIENTVKAGDGYKRCRICHKNYNKMLYLANTINVS